MEGEVEVVKCVRFARASGHGRAAGSCHLTLEPVSNRRRMSRAVVPDLSLFEPSVLAELRWQWWVEGWDEAGGREGGGTIGRVAADSRALEFVGVLVTAEGLGVVELAGAVRARERAGGAGRVGVVVVGLRLLRLGLLLPLEGRWHCGDRGYSYSGRRRMMP